MKAPFYNNPDETDWLKDDDVYKYKVDLLNKYKIAIWRFHDNWHGHGPDGFAMGNLIKLGWINITIHKTQGCLHYLNRCR